jgi:hypothetical protein
LQTRHEKGPWDRVSAPGKLGSGEAEGSIASPAGSSKPDVPGSGSHGSIPIMLSSSGLPGKRSMVAVRPCQLQHAL